MMKQPVLLALLAALALASPARAANETPATAATDLSHLQALVRTHSVNPPGNELAPARLIAGWLKDAGIPSHIYESSPGRACVIARLNAGAQPDPKHALMLLGHLDVVPVEAARWHHPPFAAELANGKLWGRGTVDMQSLDVMELRAFIALAHSHAKLTRDVILCNEADEEAGGEAGVGWLIAHHPDEVACAELINEGGSGLAIPGGRPLIGIQVAERGSYWVRVTAHGETGHGAEYRPNSAPHRLLRALARVEARPRTYELGPETSQMLQTMGKATGGFAGFVMGALTNPLLTPLLAPIAIERQPFIAPLFGTTLNPDVWRGGSKINVIPSTVSCELDIRMLPGHSVAATRAWLRGLLADDTLEITELSTAEPSRNDTRGRIYRCMADAARAVYPGVEVTPILTPGGGTDSAYFRRLGVRCYGCLPILAPSEQIATIHGDDEYITLEQLEKGGEVIERTLAAAATEP